MKNDHRPVNINLLKIKLPIAGMYIFFITYPLSVYLFFLASTNQENFTYLTNMLINSSYLATFVAFSFLVLWYHILTGVRHLIMDMHIGESLQASKVSSIFVLCIWFISVIATAMVIF
jgi:succinate dehydrogenase / fumarate reductase cytochrome b subunit